MPSDDIFAEHFVKAWTEEPKLEVPNNEEISEDHEAVLKLGVTTEELWDIDLYSDGEDEPENEGTEIDFET